VYPDRARLTPTTQLPRLDDRGVDRGRAGCAPIVEGVVGVVRPLGATVVGVRPAVGTVVSVVVGESDAPASEPVPSWASQPVIASIAATLAVPAARRARRAGCGV
jgi:hypothetical protein